MRRSRRGGHSVLEFGGSGEDSFVAVVVTKLTGALLFILLLSMVIMALVPKGSDLGSVPDSPASVPLAITTPSTLPEAVAGRPYLLALAATGGTPPYTWAAQSPLPEGLSLDSASGRISGTPARPTEKPFTISCSAADRRSTSRLVATLTVLETAKPLAPQSLTERLAALPFDVWLERGFGFLILWLIYLVGESAIGGLRRRSLAAISPADADRLRASRLRFRAYRGLLGAASISAGLLMAFWIWADKV